jgi:D-tyrosyl-tRNA(Tyr) deacylase
MKICLQRVIEASVEVNNEVISTISQGVLLLIGFSNDDKNEYFNKLINKIINLRIFPDTEGKFDKSIKDINGDILVVSQFTLFGNVFKGNRPDFTASMPYSEAEKLYEEFVDILKNSYYIDKVKRGIFGAKMLVSLKNDGPVTLIIEYP